MGQFARLLYGRTTHRVAYRTDIYHLPILEATSLSSSCVESHTPSQGCREGAMIQVVLVAAGVGLAGGSLPTALTSRSPCVCVCVWVQILPFDEDTVIRNECLA